METTKHHEIKHHREQKIVYYILGIIEVLLAFRLIFKILGANPASGFVRFLYALTRVMILPFLGIFRTAASAGYVFEPATIIAMIVYAVIAYGIVRLLKIY